MPKVNMANRKSFIWMHYKALDDSNARCNVCHKRLSYKTSISNLKKHMVKKHPLVNLNESTHYAASAFPGSGQEEEEEPDDDSYDESSDDSDDLKTLMELSKAHVKKRVEIIEEISNGNHIVYKSAHNNHNYDNDHDNDDEEEEDDLIIKRITKPKVNNSLEHSDTKIKIETSLPASEPVKKTDDSVDALVKNIGYKLRKMSEKQLMIAEYRIHEVLFLGLSSQLNFPLDDGSQHFSYLSNSINMHDTENL